MKKLILSMAMILPSTGLLQAKTHYIEKTLRTIDRYGGGPVEYHLPSPILFSLHVFAKSCCCRFAIWLTEWCKVDHFDHPNKTACAFGVIYTAIDIVSALRNSKKAINNRLELISKMIHSIPEEELDALDNNNLREMFSEIKHEKKILCLNEFSVLKTQIQTNLNREQLKVNLKKL